MTALTTVALLLVGSLVGFAIMIPPVACVARFADRMDKEPTNPNDRTEF